MIHELNRDFTRKELSPSAVFKGFCSASAHTGFVYSCCKCALAVFEGAEWFKVGNREIRSAGRSLSSKTMVSLDLFNWIGDVRYFSGGRFQKDLKKKKYAALFCGFASSLLSLECLYIGMIELNLLEKGAFSAQLGKLSLLRSSSGLLLRGAQLGTVVGLTYLSLLIGSALNTFHTAERWNRGCYKKLGDPLAKNKELDYVKVGLKLAVCSLEGSSQLLVLTKRGSPPLLLALGFFAGGVGLLYVIYSSIKKEESSCRLG